MKARSALLLAALFAAMQPAARADAQTEAWITKARAAVGTEKALDGVQSIHFTGTLEAEKLRLAIDIVFQSPYQQRINLRSDKIVETTALDGYDGWVRRAEIGKEAQWNLTLLDTAATKRLRANTWENLAFYRGIEKRGGKVEFLGEEQVDGKTCVKLMFSHADDIVFVRYFDKSTGRLVMTVTETGGEIREEGEVVVEGVRFPRKLINKTAKGEVTTITFESIKVNEPVPAGEFAVPSLRTP